MSILLNDYSILSKGVGLSDYVSIYVPTTFDKDKQLPENLVEFYRNMVESTLSDIFGGFSTQTIDGGFVENGRLIRETVYVVKAFCENMSNEDKEVIVKTCRKLKDDLKQVSVGVEINGEMFFI